VERASGGGSSATDYGAEKGSGLARVRFAWWHSASEDDRSCCAEPAGRCLVAQAGEGLLGMGREVIDTSVAKP
jgi:hypothetical protein